LLAASALAFLISGGPVGAPGIRALDLSLVAVAVAVGLQLIPLPTPAVAALSPHAPDFDSALRLGPRPDVAPLTIDAPMTREGLESLVAAVLMFWTARATFARAGLRVVLRAIATGGFLIAIIAIAQRATSPDLMWWTWPAGRNAHPFGPFVNRNHFASWLLLATSSTAGYTIAHMHSHRLSVGYSGRRLVHQMLREGTALLLAGSVVI